MSSTAQMMPFRLKVVRMSILSTRLSCLPGTRLGSGHASKTKAAIGDSTQARVVRRTAGQRASTCRWT